MLVGPHGCRCRLGMGGLGLPHCAAQGSVQSFALASQCTKVDLQKIETGDQPEIVCSRMKDFFTAFKMNIFMDYCSACGPFHGLEMAQLVSSLKKL